MIIAGKPIAITDTWIEDKRLEIVNPDGVCFTVLTNEDVSGFSEESYICTNAEVVKTLQWGEFELELTYKNGGRAEYRGRDSGENSDLSIFKDCHKGLPTNKYYFICEHWELEWLYYSKRENLCCTDVINTSLAVNGVDHQMTDQDVLALYDFLHQETPTNALLGIEDDKHKLLFAVEVEDDNAASDDITLLDKEWGELETGNWIHDMYGKN